MPPKSCRHVTLALRLSDFRRALKARESFSCDICAKQQEAPSPEDARRSWERSAAWEDLCACVSCGFVACLSGNHFAQHVQLHAKHFVGFYAGAKTFWCSPCKHELSDAKAKVEDARRECQEAFDEIASKQQRRHRSRVAVAAARPALATATKDPDPAASASADATQSSEPAKQRRSTKQREKAAETSGASEEQQKQQKKSDAAAPSAVSSVLGFTNVGNTCYFNAATQALLTAAHYFPEHVHYAETLEAPNSPVLLTFSMLHETIKKKTRRRSASSAATASKDATKVKGKSRRDAADDRPDGVLTVAPLLKEMRKKFAQFRGSYQQDAHELLLSFLWAIDEEADPPAAAASSSSSSDTADSSSSSSSAELATKDASDGLKQIFVKTDVGDTISLQVPQDATVAELQQLIAKRLNLSEDDMALAHARPSVRKSDARMVSKLNLTRNLFGGELTTVITCQACGSASTTAEDAFQLSLPVPTAAARSLSTIDCLRHFMSETALRVDANNGYDCDACSRASGRASGALRDATMRVVVSQLPRVLVIHLKRLGRLKKVTQHIQFDSFMDMAPYTNGRLAAPTCYELVAVVVHLGNKRSGHYVAYVSRSRKRDAQVIIGAADEQQQPALDSDDDLDPRAEIHTSESPSRSWYYISDTVVRRVAFEQVLQCEAYMLFYRQLPESSSVSSSSSSTTTTTTT